MSGFKRSIEVAVCGAATSMLRLNPLDYRRNALPYTDAHGCQAVATTAPLQFVQ